ncbi:MAG: glycerate kinase, partial [Actinomycetota bacterium]|nr:glycerate kinase [Actinomycetota bacterium]
MSRFLVAFDKFKGTFDAGEVVGAVAAGLRGGGAAAVEMPVADGGEGTAAALLSSLGGEWLTAATEDALSRPVEGRVALLADGRTAVVEVAEASGMWRLRAEEMDAVAASSRGTGMLMAAAVEAGADRIIVAAGGSATTDGGAGMLDLIEASGWEAEVIVACDVDIPWERAAEVFGPQKGASPAQVVDLNRRLDSLALA